MGRTLILSGHQPCYLPSLGLFAKMNKSNLFMHCGHLKFCRKSWHHRNYILLDGKRKVLSVPVQGPSSQSIRDAWYKDEYWKYDHLETIAQAYRNAPYFEHYFHRLKELFYVPPHSLERLNIALTNQIAQWLDVRAGIIDSQDWHFSGDAVDKIIQMCKAVDAGRYLSNEGAEAYLSPTEELRLQDAGIYHNWLDWKDPAEKKDPPEEPLSAIHHLFNLGPEAARLIQ